MRKTIVMGTILVLVQIPLLAYVLLQERTWGGTDRDGARGVAVRALDGSVYVTGSTRSFDPAGEDAFLLKYDAGGSLLWQRTYGEATDATTVRAESGVGVVVPPDDSGVLVAGNYNGGRIFLAKFDHDGGLIWDLTWGGDQESAAGISLASDGTIYVIGVTRSFDVGQGDAFLLSFGPDGTLNWQRTWGGPFFDVPRGVAVATDGGIYISGDTTFSANSAFLVKFGADGSVIVQREWAVVGKSPFPDDDETLGGGVAAAPDGGVYVAAWTFGAGFNPNLIAAQFDAAGNAVWHRVGGPGFGAALAIAVGPDGNVHVTGNILSEDELTGGNAFVWTLLGNGKPDSAAIWGGNEEFEGEGGEGIAVTASGDIIVVGAAGAPPYTLSRGSKNGKSVDAVVAEIAGTVTEPAGVVGVTAAAVNAPAGSETFAGVSDAFLIRLQQ
jgi:hypothetical protein